MNPLPGPPGLRGIVALCLLLLAAAGAQGVLAQRLYAHGGQPDFILTVVLAAALLSDAGTGSLMGLAGGLLTAALTGETVGTFLVSRVAAGFVAGSFASRLFRTNLGVVILTVLAASLVAEALYFLAAPRVGVRPWLLAAAVGAAWNAAAAVPVTLLLRRLGWGREEF